MVDASALGADGGFPVEVQVLSSAQQTNKANACRSLILYCKDIEQTQDLLKFMVFDAYFPRVFTMPRH